MSFTEVLTEFFNTNDHAVSAVYTPAVGSPSTINLIFNNEFVQVGGSEIGIESSQPIATCRTSDVSGVLQLDTLVISSVTYKVSGIHVDGTGVTELFLEKQ